jgi:ribosomal protein S18 acetylase RimI-like enzyme
VASHGCRETRKNLAVSEVRIDRARASDLEALYGILFHLHGDSPWRESRSAAANAALRSILADKRRALMIARVNGEAVGTIDVIVSPNLTREVHPFAVIENVVVAPAARRRGIGRRLMEAALDFAQSCGCYKVQLVSANKRDAAHHLYDAIGFDADVSGYRRYLIKP